MRKEKIGFICSGGGHLAEILPFTSGLDKREKFLVTNEYKHNVIRDNNAFRSAYMIKHIRLNPVVLLVDLVKILFILIIERPAVLISTGAEIAIPFFYLGKFLFGSKLIYIESCAQVSSPSLTGRMVYPITDLFLVQWPQLLHLYGEKARYAGNLI